MHGSILIVEDVAEMADLIKDNLEFEGLEASTAASAEDALLALARGTDFDLVILDLNLPGMDGFEFLQKLRRQDRTPVMIVSARGEDSDVVTALGIGADEYLTKPFSPKALVARARALIRRSRDYQSFDVREVVRFGSFELDLNAGILTRDGERVPLSSREFAVLSYLIQEMGKTHKPEEIYESAWNHGFGDTTAVGIYIQRLRRKIEKDPSDPRYILTVRGLGYCFVNPEEAAKAAEE